MDPRIKIVLLIVYIVLAFVASTITSITLMIALVVFIMLLSKVSLMQYIKSLKMILVIVIITSFLNLFYGSGDPIFQLGFITITAEGIKNSIFIAVRIVSLILVSSVLTFTTTPTDLTDAIERLLKPLKLIKVPVHDIAMMMTIALRFIPTLLEEADKIMNAQKARGADMETGSLKTRAKALIPILIPLFVSSFRRAYELAVAMECRCYNGGNGKTRMKILHISKLDYIATGFTMLSVVGVVLCNQIIFPLA